MRLSVVGAHGARGDVDIFVPHCKLAHVLLSLVFAVGGELDKSTLRRRLGYLLTEMTRAFAEIRVAYSPRYD